MPAAEQQSADFKPSKEEDAAPSFGAILLGTKALSKLGSTVLQGLALYSAVTFGSAAAVTSAYCAALVYCLDQLRVMYRETKKFAKTRALADELWVWANIVAALEHTDDKSAFISALSANQNKPNKLKDFTGANERARFIRSYAADLCAWQLLCGFNPFPKSGKGLDDEEWAQRRIHHSYAKEAYTECLTLLVNIFWFLQAAHELIKVGINTLAAIAQFGFMRDTLNILNVTIKRVEDISSKTVAANDYIKEKVALQGKIELYKQKAMELLGDSHKIENIEQLEALYHAARERLHATRGGQEKAGAEDFTSKLRNITCQTIEGSPDIDFRQFSPQTRKYITLDNIWTTLCAYGKPKQKLYTGTKDKFGNAALDEQQYPTPSLSPSRG